MPENAYYASTALFLRQAATALSDAGQALDAAARALLRAVNEGAELEPSATPPLRGAELSRIAVEVARGRARPDEEMHYRDWFALVERAGYRVGGRDPLATFLTALSRAVEVEQVGGRSGLYRLREVDGG